MREIPLTKGAVALVDDEDYARVAAFKWHRSKSGYAARTDRRVGKRYVMMHRFVLGFPDAPQIDHVDLNGLNNQKANLRPCTPTQNLRNRPPLKGREFKGITFRHEKGRWEAGIYIARRRLFLGTYKTDVAAARAYDAAAIKYFGEFAWLNFPDALIAARAETSAA